jgi:2-dehydropantoate 2-reductase
MNASNGARATVAVVGVGGIGGVAAATLGAADRHNVIVCTRRALPTLALERPEGDVALSLRSLANAANAPVVDWVLLCTKAHQTDSAAPWLARLCGPSTRVAVLQNGIGHARRVAPLAGAALVVPTIVYFNGERVGDGRVRLRHATAIDLAVADDEAGRAFARLFDDTPLKVATSADFTTLAWRKLLLNVSANPITALTAQRQSVLRRADVRTLCLAILDEAVAVARAEGAHLGENESVEALATLMTYPPEAGTSMYFDRLAGRPLEAEALTGPIVEAGQRHGIPTPINSALLTLLRAISDAAGL